MPDNPPWWRNYEAVKRCRNNYHRHEIFGGYNRQKSIDDGLVIYLRPEQHNMDNGGIHFNPEYRKTAQQAGQKAYEALGHTRQEFIQRYGKNYL